MCVAGLAAACPRGLNCESATACKHDCVDSMTDCANYPITLCDGNRCVVHPH
ncbi:MAG TPA: hypothetical protein VGM56_27345 [Byssovorax sp.]